MYPDDRVLIGVINRKRDFDYAQNQHWYRIPVDKMERGIFTEYLAFFLSGAVFKERSGGVHYFAKRKGFEMLSRRDLLPDEPSHKNAEKQYYKVQLEPLIPKLPPILNHSKRSVSFIYTTWDRFVHAETISELYSEADYYVDRIYHALRDVRLRPQRTWEAEHQETGLPPQIRILCEDGSTFVASTEPDGGQFHLDASVADDEILHEILLQITRRQGPASIHIPVKR